MGWFFKRKHFLAECFMFAILSAIFISVATWLAFNSLIYTGFFLLCFIMALVCLSYTINRLITILTIKKPAILINQDGIINKTTRAGKKLALISWQEIRKVSLDETKQTLILQLVENEKFFKIYPLWFRMICRGKWPICKRCYQAALTHTIYLANVRADAKEVYAHAQQLFNASRVSNSRRDIE